MPIYRYRCEQHGEFDHSHSMKDSLKECPVCPPGTPVEKVFQSFAVNAAKDPQVGQVVKNTIEETREEIKRDKEKLGDRVWK